MLLCQSTTNIWTPFETNIVWRPMSPFSDHNSSVFGMGISHVLLPYMLKWAFIASWETRSNMLPMRKAACASPVVRGVRPTKKRLACNSNYSWRQGHGCSKTQLWRTLVGFCLTYCFSVVSIILEKSLSTRTLPPAGCPAKLNRFGRRALVRQVTPKRLQISLWLASIDPVWIWGKFQTTTTSAARHQPQLGSVAERTSAWLSVKDTWKCCKELFTALDFLEVFFQKILP